MHERILDRLVLGADDKLVIRVSPRSPRADAEEIADRVRAEGLEGRVIIVAAEEIRVIGEHSTVWHPNA